jgi:hypothetical protein
VDDEEAPAEDDRKATPPSKKKQKRGVAKPSRKTDLKDASFVRKTVL